eukprot:TRINITY_DN24425_c0_g1_i1.p1 TRINITY_DN24425_c0_g1~~TRINITY_DN24425_c0_g1_i1.p1  ORF type:complete len:421 (+),score=94.38 TRINITY_DN24425_c0_g1_i1:64-1326(+)
MCIRDRREFASLGFYPRHLQLIGQKLANVRDKIPSKLAKEQLKLWFASLTPSDRVRALMIRSPILTWTIKFMYTRLLLFKNCIFSFTVQNSQLLYNGRKAGQDERSPEEEKLLSAVRLSNDLELLDTFSIAREFVVDTKELFRTLEKITNNNFAMKPCRLYKTGNFYTWEFPTWFNYTEANTIEKWIAANIERLLWFGYGTKLSEIAVEKMCTPLDTRSQLLEFWQDLSNDERARVRVQFVQLMKDDSMIDNEYRRKTALRLNEIVRDNSEEVLVDTLVFRKLEEICLHDVWGMLVNIIKNMISNKAEEELINELDGKEEYKPLDLAGMDIGLITAKKNTRYDHIYKEKIISSEGKVSKRKKKRKAKSNSKNQLASENTKEDPANTSNIEGSKAEFSSQVNIDITPEKSGKKEEQKFTLN